MSCWLGLHWEWVVHWERPHPRKEELGGWRVLRVLWRVGGYPLREGRW